MAPDKFQKRLEKLFADIERVASDVNMDADSMRRELSALRERVVEVETRLLALQEKSPDQKENADMDVSPPQPSSRPEARWRLPDIYEKAQIGYTFTGKELRPVNASVFQEVDLERAIQTQLVDMGQPVGAMILEPAPEHPWSPEDNSLAEKVARQVSLQIQNLRLLAAAERARAEAQAATRRFTHESWQAFLDGIHESERIGYSYDQIEVAPFGESAPGDVDIQETVHVLDEQVGRFFLQANPDRPFTEQDKFMVAAIARQVGQQVENLRLLAEASRARAQAEEATRLLSRENWMNFVAERDESSLGFLYNTTQVLPLSDVQLDQEITYAHPLSVQGQVIGQLAIAGQTELSPENAALFSEVAGRVSAHIETLRLNEELRRRAIELQELDRLKSSFLANMSHELRTPLNAILGFSDVMLEGIDGELTDYMVNDLKLIQKNGQHLLHLINDVLDMAKIESGRMNLHLEKFNLHGLFEDVYSITSSLANERKNALRIDDGSSRELEVFADVTRIRQVMINLVNNAIKFTENGDITIRAVPKGNDFVLITVKDTGLGIPADHLEKIFQEFAQVDTSTTRKAGGTGLGLPISRRLVDMHGGRMWAESEGLPGRGSTFFVELPLEARIVDVAEKKVK
jgi:signal transduction histidine kinase